MPFTVSDFEDLVRLLHEHPEWRERLRSVLLPEEMLTLPQLVRENSEAIRRLEEAVAQLIEAQRRTEQRVDDLSSQVGRLINIIGATLEEEAQASVATLIRYKGYKAEQDGYPGRIDSIGDIDVVLPVESPTGERLTVVAESKARLSRRAVIVLANRMKSPGFRRKLKKTGVPGPYLVYMYAIRVDPVSLDEARKLGIGIMSGRGELVEPAGSLPEA